MNIFLRIGSLSLGRGSFGEFVRASYIRRVKCGLVLFREFRIVCSVMGQQSPL